MAEAFEVLSAFFALGEVQSCTPYGGGHINDTRLVQTKGGKRYILQRLNTNVFREGEAVMQNIAAVTAFLKDGKGNERTSLSLRYTLFGDPYLRTGEGDIYRVYNFVERTCCYEKTQDLLLVYGAGYAFGQFGSLLAGFCAQSLHEVIPHFHDTPYRLAALWQAQQKDLLGRANEVSEQLAFVRTRVGGANIIIDALRRGELPLRVTHNDTKLSNVLFEENTGKPVCVVDLDTVMPGSRLFDYGEGVRSAASSADEDDPARMHFCFSNFEAYTRGYLAGAPDSTPEELKLFAFGPRLMTFENGVRFLTDYLQGDIYFKTSRPAQNLDRARAMFCLLHEMEEQFENMQRYISSIDKKYKKAQNNLEEKR